MWWYVEGETKHDGIGRNIVVKIRAWDLKGLVGVGGSLCACMGVV